MRDIVQLLGYPSGTKLLIVHADDFGMCQSVNLAISTTLEQGSVSSASVMVTCPGFVDAARIAARNPKYDVGIHLTVTSEWSSYKWGPVLKRESIPGMTDEEGFFWPSADLITAHPQYVENEIVAQIELAKGALGHLSHVDCHMYALAKPTLIVSYVNASQRFGLPFLINRYLYSVVFRGQPCAAYHSGAGAVHHAPDIPGIDLEGFYVRILHELKPGLHQLVVHPGLDDSELRAITGENPFGAAWRQRDFNFLMSRRFKSAVCENGIQITSWKAIRSAFLKNQQASIPSPLGVVFA